MTDQKPPTWPEILVLVVFVWLPILAILTAAIYTIITLGGSL